MSLGLCRVLLFILLKSVFLFISYFASWQKCNLSSGSSTLWPGLSLSSRRFTECPWEGRVCVTQCPLCLGGSCWFILFTILYLVTGLFRQLLGHPLSQALCLASCPAYFLFHPVLYWALGKGEVFITLVTMVGDTESYGFLYMGNSVSYVSTFLFVGTNLRLIYKTPIQSCERIKNGTPFGQMSCGSRNTLL